MPDCACGRCNGALPWRPPIMKTNSGRGRAGFSCLIITALAACPELTPEARAELKLSRGGSTIRS